MKFTNWIMDKIGGAQSLRRKVLSGGGWLLGRSVLLGVVDITRTAVFARILSAQDYGIMALVTMVSGLLTSFTYLGLDLLIQRDGTEAKRNFPVYWTVKCIRGVVCFSLSFLAAPYIASYYNTPGLVLLIRLMSISFLIEGCAGFGKEVCQLEMQFKKIVQFEVILSILSLIFGTIAVMYYKDATALVINQILTISVQFVLSYILYPWNASLKWNTTLFKKIMLFSSSVITINILTYIQTSFDRATIGKIFDMDTLGFYARGHFLSQIPVTYFSMIVAPLFLPVYKTIGDDLQRLRRALIRIMMVYSVIFISAGIVFFAFARIFITIIYGEKWLPVMPVFRILLIYGISKSIVSSCQPVFFLKDKPWMVMINSFIMVIIFCACCIPLTKKYGIEGTAWSIVAGALVAHIVCIIQVFYLVSDKNGESYHSST